MDGGEMGADTLEEGLTLGSSPRSPFHRGLVIPMTESQFIAEEF